MIIRHPQCNGVLFFFEAIFRLGFQIIYDAQQIKVKLDDGLASMEIKLLLWRRKEPVVQFLLALRDWSG